jgi:hypothetical protein
MIYFDAQDTSSFRCSSALVATDSGDGFSLSLNNLYLLLTQAVVFS